MDWSTTRGYSTSAPGPAEAVWARCLAYLFGASGHPPVGPPREFACAGLEPLALPASGFLVIATRVWQDREHHWSLLVNASCSVFANRPRAAEVRNSDLFHGPTGYRIPPDSRLRYHATMHAWTSLDQLGPAGGPGSDLALLAPRSRHWPMLPSSTQKISGHGRLYFGVGMHRTILFIYGQRRCACHEPCRLLRSGATLSIAGGQLPGPGSERRWVKLILAILIHNIPNSAPSLRLP
jgi:hypothetical protein